MAVPEFALGCVTLRPLTRTEPECLLWVLSFGASLQQFWVKKTRVGLGICINLDGSDTWTKLWEAQPEGRSPGTLENLPPLVGWKILSAESKQTESWDLLPGPSSPQGACSQDWGAVQWSRQQGLEVGPVWGPWGNIFLPFFYLFKF